MGFLKGGSSVVSRRAGRACCSKGEAVAEPANAAIPALSSIRRVIFESVLSFASMMVPFPSTRLPRGRPPGFVSLYT